MSRGSKSFQDELPVLIPVAVLVVCCWWIVAGLSSALFSVTTEPIGVVHLVLALFAGAMAILQLGIRNSEAIPGQSFSSRNAYSLVAVAALLVGAWVAVPTLL